MNPLLDMDAYRNKMTGNGGSYNPSAVQVRGRISATKINESKPTPTEQTLNVSAKDAPIPLLYGEVSVPAMTALAYPDPASPSYLYYVAVWGFGEVYSIDLYINGAPPSSSIAIRHYRGTTYQIADSWLADAIVLYDDDLILRKPAGNVGISYSVLRVPASITEVPQVSGILKAALVYDPDSTSNGDPFNDLVGAWFDFEVSATDQSANAHTLTLSNGAALGGSPQELLLDGTDDYASLPDHATLEFGGDPWTLEVVCTPYVVSAGSDAIVGKGTTTGPDYCMRIARNGTDLRLSLSNSGTSYDIVGNLDVATGVFSAGVEVVITLEFTGREYVVWVDGAEVYRITSSLTLKNVTGGFQIGARNTSDNWDGSIRSFKFTKALRYGGCHSATARPFADSDSYRAGFVYSDNAALCFADVATNSLYGMGTTVSGLADCKAWDDEEIATGIARARLSLAINAPQKTEALLDLLATYAELLWVHEGSSIKMIPDKPVTTASPHGQNIVKNSGFDSIDWWTIDGSWSISGGVAS